MTVLVTGSGLLGCHIAQCLQGRGTPVILFDLRHRHDVIGRYVNSSSARLITGDVADIDSLARIVEEHGIEFIVHTAAVLARSAALDPPLAVRVNVLGGCNVLEIARRYRLKRAVLASSGTVEFGLFDSFNGRTIEEDFPMRALSQAPRSFYSVTKLTTEHLVGLYADRHKVDSVALRYGAILGGLTEDDPGLVAQLAFQCLRAARANAPLQWNDRLLVWGGKEEFLDPRDAARATVAALFATNLRQSVYHVTSNRSVTLEEFAVQARSAFPGLQAELPAQITGGFAGAPHARPAPSDTAAAQRDLGFVAQYSVEDSLRYLAAMNARE